jgi:MoxR-like ATPase
MQERQVTIGRQTHPLPDPFLVMATQNPIESDGTYPLPEAQVDRFMLKVLVDYPSGTEEFVIVERMITGLETIQSVLGATQLSALQKETRNVYVDPSLIEYAVKVSSATRDLTAVGLGDMAAYVTYGVSPRASIYKVMAAQALALMRGRDYTLPEDVYAVSRDVLRHRLVLSYEALGDNVTAEDVLGAILAQVPLPQASAAAEERSTPARKVDDRAWAPPPR